MARPRKTTPDGVPATDASRGASRAFARRSAGDRGALTHDVIAADLDAFRQAGGTSEALGPPLSGRKKAV